MKRSICFLVGMGMLCWSAHAVGQERGIGEICADARAFVEKWRAAQGFELKSAALLDMTWLHGEVMVHSQLARSDELQSVRRVLAARIRDGVSELKREIIKWLRKSRSPSLAAHPHRPGLSAGRAAWSGEVQGGLSHYELQSWATYQQYQGDRYLGGLNQYLGYLPGNFAPPGHHADALIRMIERTISPDAWQRNGGNSVIEYYGPAMVLVIRADQRTHDQVYDLLQTLRDRER